MISLYSYAAIWVAFKLVSKLARQPWFVLTLFDHYFISKCNLWWSCHFIVLQLLLQLHLIALTLAFCHANWFIANESCSLMSSMYADSLWASRLSGGFSDLDDTLEKMESLPLIAVLLNCIWTWWMVNIHISCLDLQIYCAIHKSPSLKLKYNNRNNKLLLLFPKYYSLIMNFIYYFILMFFNVLSFL